jgi:aspartate kinase
VRPGHTSGHQAGGGTRLRGSAARSRGRDDVRQTWGANSSRDRAEDSGQGGNDSREPAQRGGVVMKFGGTSVADAAAISRLSDIVQRQVQLAAGGRLPVVVVSALGGITDQLIAAARFAEEGAADRSTALLQQILERHLTVVSGVTTGERQAALAELVRAEFNALIGLTSALAVLRDVSPRSLDAVVATGELTSSRIVAAALAERGFPATWVDSREVMITDAEHTCAAPDMTETEARMRPRFEQIGRAGQLAVMGGFIGSTTRGVTTTLGRGGSDYSAAIVGACIDSGEIQIWTDVDGMLTADPRVVATPRLVPRLSFAEASELAYFGAKVLHPSTILPAVAKDIPVRILNSRRPECPGTLITATPAPGGGITALACKRHVTVVNITSTRMLMAYGFLRRLFEIFERFKTAVDVVTTSEVSVSVTVDDERQIEAIAEHLGQFAEVAWEPEMAILCLVGENLRTDPKLFGRSTTALDGIPLRLVSQAASRRNVTFVLRDSDVGTAMKALHDEFFK